MATSRQQSIDQMLEAIASTEQGLANIVKGEAGKINTAIKIHRQTKESSLDDLLGANKSVESMMRKIIMKEMLLNFQLEDVVSLEVNPDPKPEPVYPDRVDLRCTGKYLLVGETFCYTATIHPASVQNPSLYWHSSDPAIATVDANGCVLAQSPGTVTIVVETANGHGAKCELRVGIAPESLEIEPDDVSMDIGGTQVLTPIILPTGAVPTVTWTSDDPSIATVAQDGTVTGVSYGATIITATTINGISATATAQVVSPPT